LPWYHHSKARLLLSAVYTAVQTDEFSGLAGGAHFKELHGGLKGTYQLRIAGQYRIRFKWASSGTYEIQAGTFHDED
jgi:plasmid maintenance system killer protein